MLRYIVGLFIFFLESVKSHKEIFVSSTCPDEFSCKGTLKNALDSMQMDNSETGFSIIFLEADAEFSSGGDFIYKVASTEGKAMNISFLGCRNCTNSKKNTRINFEVGVISFCDISILSFSNLEFSFSKIAFTAEGFSVFLYEDPKAKYLLVMYNTSFYRIPPGDTIKKMSFLINITLKVTTVLTTFWATV